MKNSFKIAIDGPVGVGKGTLAAALSKEFGALYINTGAMYRALTLKCLRENIDIHNDRKVVEALLGIKIDLNVDELANQQVLLNGEDVSSEIFMPQVSSAVAVISAYKDVRKEMVRRQKEMVSECDKVIIEGRDIATEVASNAQLKIYLTAGIKERVQRRYKQIKEKGINMTLETVMSETEKRDKMDMERQASPLVIAKGAFVLDTTNLTVPETVKKVEAKMKEKGLA